MRKPKLRQVDLSQLGNLTQALEVAATSVAAAQEYGRLVRDDANKQINEHRELMQRHLDRKDLRPNVVFKPQPKNVWTVAFNSETYALGPYDPIPLDDDVMPYWWMTPDGNKIPCRSSFQGLIAIIQHFCNVEEPDATGPVSSPPDPV